MANVEIRLISEQELESQAIPLEFRCFHPDEAATPEKMRYRYTHAPHLFMGMFADQDNRMIGLCMSTQSDRDAIDGQSMSQHCDHGQTIFLHSICVDPAWQRRGLATQMLQEYVTRCRNVEGAKSIQLLSHRHLIPFYQHAAGFVDRGLSSVQHGPEAWYRMDKSLLHSSD
eukprot:Partr_v1_DN28350_c1_g1_i6_m79286 putative Aralkylamine N-acetyltransferase